MTQKRKPPAHAFPKGVSGNPKGKPTGTRSKATRLLMALMDDGANAITQAVIAKAKEGDLVAARIILDRLIPPAKERPITMTLPDTSDASGISAAQSAILQAVGAGDLLPGEGAILSGIVETRRKAIETQELDARITALEGIAK